VQALAPACVLVDFGSAVSVDDFPDDHCLLLELLRLHADRCLPLKHLRRPMNSMMTFLSFFVDVDRRRLQFWTIVRRHHEHYHAHRRLSLPTTSGACHRLLLPTISVLYVECRHLLHSATVDLAAGRFHVACRLLQNPLFDWCPLMTISGPALGRH